ncbi:MAG: restriction endonuclease subunit S [Microbacterium sp.]
MTSQTLTVDDVCLRVTSGGTPSRRVSEYFEGTIPWLKTQELRDGWVYETDEHITRAAVENSSAKLLPTNTVMMAMYGATVGKLAILGTEMTCNQAACAMIVDPDKADYRYLYYALLNDRLRIVDRANGAAQQNLSARTIKALEYKFPPVDEQRAIAATLGALDDKIESNRRAISLLDRLFSAQFSRLLESSRSISNLPLSDVATITRGRSYKSAELSESPVALVTLKSIDRNGGYKQDGLKPYVGPYKTEQVVAPGEIVVAQTDLTQGAEVVGRGVRVPISEAHNTLVASLDLAILRPKDTMPVEYLLGLLSSESFRQHCRNHVTGTTVLHLAKDAMPTWMAPVVSAAEQEAFSSVARGLLARVDSFSSENQRLTELRDALLPELLSGRIRVADVEVP